MNHEIGLAVWDVPSPVVIGRQATLKIGVSCPSGCSLNGTTIVIRDEQGRHVGSARIASEPWPGSIALHWVEVDIGAPETDGTHAWSIQATADDSVHPAVESAVRIVTSKPPEHRVTVEVTEQGRGAPLAGVELRVGPFRAVTDDGGIAHVKVPGGTYDVCAWKIDHDLLTTTTHVAGDTTLTLAMAVTLPPEQPYWM